MSLTASFGFMPSLSAKDLVIIIFVKIYELVPVLWKCNNMNSRYLCMEIYNDFYFIISKVIHGGVRYG
jgi:hypothetical protein